MKIISFILMAILSGILLYSCGDSVSCVCNYNESCIDGKCECINTTSLLWGRCIAETREDYPTDYTTVHYVYQVENPPSGSNFDQTLLSFDSYRIAVIRNNIGNSNTNYLNKAFLYKYNYLDHPQDQNMALSLIPVSPYFVKDSLGNLTVLFKYGGVTIPYSTGFFKDYNLSSSESLLVDIFGYTTDDLKTINMTFIVNIDENKDSVPDRKIDSFDVKYVLR